MRAFENWFTQEVEDLLGLVQVSSFKPLTDWLRVVPQPDAYEERSLNRLAESLADNADFWNEDELKLNFIAPLLFMVTPWAKPYKPFSQRRLRAVVNDIEIGGIVDYMIAQGRQIPKKPIFCLHEYKQEAKRDTDPKGQLLVEMVAAQEINADGRPVYGCYITGRFVFFVVLHGLQYGVSLAYDATRMPQLLDILAILEKLKTYLPPAELANVKAARK